MRIGPGVLYSFGSYRLNLFKGRESPQPHTTRQAWAKFFLCIRCSWLIVDPCAESNISLKLQLPSFAHTLFWPQNICGASVALPPSFCITASSQTPHIYCLREPLVWEPRVLKLSWDQHLGYWLTFCLCESEDRERVKRGDVRLGEFSSSIP